MKRVLGAAALAVAIVVGAALSGTYLPAVIWPDAPVPSSLAASMPAARQILWTEGSDGLRLPLHLTYMEARCAADGSVAVIFEEHRPPYTDTKFAYAVRGSMPAGSDEAWGGGYGIPGPVLGDDEFIHLMGRDPARCAP